MGTIGDRATVIFAQASDKIIADCKAMHADHSAKGLLRSGSTLRSAARIFCENSNQAQSQVLTEVAHKIEHRGRAWSAAMAEVKDALEAHAANAPAMLEASFRVAATPGVAAHRATMTLIDECVADLKAKVEAFEAGWTAPKARLWTERHPVIWAISLSAFSLIAGALITLLLMR